MKRIAYFGGTFDPPHLGHHQIVSFLARSADVDQVLIVPTSQNPLKREGAQFAFEARRELIRAWESDLKDLLPPAAYAKVKIHWLEMESQTTAYTVDTLAALKKEWPTDSAVFLALGEDNLASFKKWKEPARLLGLLHSVWIFPRRSTGLDPSRWDESLRSLCPVRWTGFAVDDLSSTEVRRRWRESGEIDPRQLTPRCAKKLIEILGHSSG